MLDETHLLETELVRFRGIVISRKKWRRYIPDLQIDYHGYDVQGWTGFITDIKEKMLNLKIPAQNQELLIEAAQDIEKLVSTIDSISLNPRNWICIRHKDGGSVTGVELKPLDVSPYCKEVFRKCEKTLMMSATILDPETLCSDVGGPTGSHCLSGSRRLPGRRPGQGTTLRQCP